MRLRRVRKPRATRNLAKANPSRHRAEVQSRRAMAKGGRSHESSTPSQAATKHRRQMGTTTKPPHQLVTRSLRARQTEIKARMNVRKSWISAKPSLINEKLNWTSERRPWLSVNKSRDPSRRAAPLTQRKRPRRKVNRASFNLGLRYRRLYGQNRGGYSLQS
jgi:hypothetical protein